jgi:hypothetical protein
MPRRNRKEPLELHTREFPVSERNRTRLKFSKSVLFFSKNA